MLSIIIPAYNEEKTIAKLLDSVRNAFADVAHEIIVVDDGSRDQTRNICQENSQTLKNIKYIRLEKNSGKGKALRVGFENATGKYVAIQDADLEYDPATLRELYNQITKSQDKKEKNLAVYGKRDRKQGYVWNKIGNVLISEICNVLYGSKLFDIYTCYKIIPTDILKSLNLNSNGFEIEAEITAKLLKNKIQILELPITYSPRTFEQGKHIRAKDGLVGAWTLVKNRF